MLNTDRYITGHTVLSDQGKMPLIYTNKKHAKTSKIIRDESKSVVRCSMEIALTLLWWSKSVQTTRGFGMSPKLLERLATFATHCDDVGASVHEVVVQTLSGFEMYPREHLEATDGLHHHFEHTGANVCHQLHLAWL